jgi:Protein of unknown function (DUF3592)
MNKKIGFLIAAICIYGFFYFVIPVTLVHSAQFFWAFVGSILTAVCIFFIGYKSEEERYDMDNYKANNSKMTISIVLAILVGLGGAIVLYFRFASREEKFIAANPVISIGTVVDGKSTTTTRRGSSSTSYELDVTYKDSNAVEYRTEADISSEEWNNAGKGMPVTVVYEKNNPTVCKVIMKSKDAMAYIGKDKKIFPSLKNLQAFLNTKDYNEQKKLLGDYWSVNKMEDSEDDIEFTNGISRDNLAVMSIGNIYVNEFDNDFAYNAILQEAKATMKVVYDSMATNTTKGILLQNDSMQIRFQSYSTSSKMESGGEFNFSMLVQKRIYCFGFNKKDKMMLLPGDLQGLENQDNQSTVAPKEISPEQIREIIQQKTK